MKKLIIGAVVIFVGLLLIALGNIGTYGWHIERKDDGSLDASEEGSRTGVFVGLSGALILACGIYQAIEALLGLAYIYAYMEGAL